MTLGKLIRRERLKQNLSQQDISRALKLTSAQYISNVERGICPLAPRFYKKVARMLDISVESMIDAQVAEYRQQVINKMNAKY